MKIAVFFPGIGYHVDKPLLYYSRSIAGQYGYETVNIAYSNLGKARKEAFESAFTQAESCLGGIEWNAYDDILFVSKSIGTVVSAAYAKRHNLSCRNIYYTPLEETFAFHPQPGIVFHGTGDSWAPTKKIIQNCRENGLVLHIIEEGNHSLEIKGETQKNLRSLKEIMGFTESYISDSGM